MSLVLFELKDEGFFMLTQPLVVLTICCAPVMHEVGPTCTYSTLWASSKSNRVTGLLECINNGFPFFEIVKSPFRILKVTISSMP